MKLFVFIIPLVFSQSIALVSPENVTEELNRLISLVDEKKGAAEVALVDQYDQTKAELNKQLNENLISSLNQINEDIDGYIQDLEKNTLSLGYNSTDCITKFQLTIVVGGMPNVTNKAITEMSVVYERLISNIQTTGLYSMNLIANEILSIINDSTTCLFSEEPSSCTGPLLSKILDKEEEIPVLFDKEVQRITNIFIQQVVNYESRVQEYLHEAVSAVQPYLELLESCVSILLAVGTTS